MSAPIPSLLLIATTLIVGWASLWPLRNSLQRPAYHLLAFPIGLLGWTFATATAVLVGTYTALTAGAGLLLFVVGFRVIIAMTVTSPALDDVPHARQLPGFAIATLAYLSVGSLLSLAGVTATTADSWKGYWPLGVMIVNQGTFTPYLPSARGFMLPSVSAASLFFGTEWEYVIYPLLAAVVGLGLAYVIVRSGSDPARRRLPALIALATLAFLATDPSFLYHSLYDFHTEFIELSGKINEDMPYYVVRRLMDALNDQHRPLAGSRVIVLGVAYKANIDDMRESPAIKVVEILHSKKADVVYHDPFVPRFSVNGRDVPAVKLTAEEISSADAIVLVTDHGGVDYSLVVENAKLVLDTRNALKEFESDCVVRL